MIERLIRIMERENVEWEIYWERGRGGSFKIENEKLERSQRKFHSGIGLRVGYKGRLGFSYITGIGHDIETLENFVKRTIKLARVSEVPFRGFPSEKKPAKIRGLYDKRIDEIPFEDAHAMAQNFAERMIELKAGREEYTLSGSLAFGVNFYGIANSNGIFLEDKSTGMSVSTYAVKKGTRTGSGSYYQSYRSLQSFEELERAIKLAIEDADMSWDAERFRPYEGELLLEPPAFRAIMGIFLENLFGDNVHYGRSRFVELGKRVASEKLTITDDATIDNGIGSYPFDGEGNPGRKTVLVEEGFLRGFLLDETYGWLLGMESTGNAVRDFRTVPHIGTSNVVVEPGKESLEDFEGIVIKKVFGEHTANPISGDFSLTVELGYVVRGGKVEPFKDNMLVGNVFELLDSIRAVGKELIRRGSFYSPRVLAIGKII
ncbi:TldD/PmbA family protein [Thermococcus sp. GR6]|uniref:TldD/PmbA family protein n=1 Tax=Thermococcus sp. GR6 TaxID=1638256 RepID=UPI00142FC005|nr:TldD/PmbA family protein [Thermococcus sp. GR6]NJE43275.1 TldD/PmbA family protein [Thermococcus sp. GR6]